MSSVEALDPPLPTVQKLPSCATAARSPIDEWTILTRRTLARKKRLAVPRSCAISETDLVSGYAGEVSRG